MIFVVVILIVIVVLITSCIIGSKCITEIYTV